MHKKLVSVQWIYEQDRGHSQATDEVLGNYYKLLKEKLPADSPIFREHSAEDLLVLLTKQYFLSERQFEESDRDETRDFAFDIGYQTDNLTKICEISGHLALNNIDPELILSTPVFDASLRIRSTPSNSLLKITAALLNNKLSFAQQVKLTELLQHYKGCESELDLIQMVEALRKIVNP
jgi:hypothetical protein